MARSQPVERFTGDKLHGYEINTVSLVDVVDVNDVGMTQSRCGLGFLNKPLFAGRIGDLFRRQDLDGNEAVEVGVAGFIDDTHPTRAELLDDRVMSDGSADH